MSFFEDMNSKLQNFMVGRNGSDRLGRWCLGAAIIFLIINMIMPNAVCSMLSFALLFYCIYRMFSTDVPARSQENEKFESLIAKLPFVKGDPSSSGNDSTGSQASSMRGSKGRANAARGRNDASPRASADAPKMTFACEECGQALSVPSGRGKLKVTCPKCHHQMTVES